MKITKLIKITLIVVISVFYGVGLNAQWQQDSKYGFKIKIPSNWSKNSYMDGTDQVYNYMSPDENTAVQLRAFKAGAGFTTTLLAQVYEENMLPNGTQKISLNDYTTSNGIPCKKGVYLIDYNETEVGLSALYIVQNENGYVLTALIPSSMIQQKGDELKQIIKSFTIEGYQTKTEKTTGTSGLGGLSGSTSSEVFKINSIVLTDRVDSYEQAINPTNKFNTKTAEIFAVVQYSGAAKNDLIVSWIFDDWNRMISTDAFVFTGNKGGNGVVSLTKPTNDWPAGNYTVKFEMNGKVVQKLNFTVLKQESNSGGLSGTTSGGNIVGKYNLVSRSDNKSKVNYHFIKIKSDGTYWEEYQPKDSGGYVSENAGTWKVDGNKLILTQRYGGVSDSYTIKGNELIRTSGNGIDFTFRK